MRKLLAVAVPAALAIVAAVLVSNAFQRRGESAEARLERARLRREFAERAALAVGIPADRAAEWQGETTALLRWWFDELSAVRNRHPGEPRRPNGVEAAREERKGKLSEKERATLEEFQRYADERVALLRDGRYAALRSASDGGVRLDLLRVEPGASPEGGAPALRIDFALWGVPRYVERERQGERTASRTVVPVVFKQISFRFLDAKGKPYGEMNGPGEPYLKLADPERFTDELPPELLFGTWWVELFPREAVTAELEVGLGARGASGTERPIALKASLPVADAWKLPPGTAYQGEIRVEPAAR